MSNLSLFFVDRNEENENEYNRMSIPLSFMLKKGPTQQTNWGATLTKAEARYAYSKWGAVRHHARADLQGVGYALDRRCIRNIARHSQSASMVHSRYHQGAKLAIEG